MDVSQVSWQLPPKLSIEVSVATLREGPTEQPAFTSARCPTRPRTSASLLIDMLHGKFAERRRIAANQWLKSATTAISRERSCILGWRNVLRRRLPCQQRLSRQC